MVPHIKTSKGLTITLSTGKPVQVITDHIHYKEIQDLLTVEPSEQVDSKILELIYPVNKVKKIFVDSNLSDVVLELNEYGQIICTYKNYNLPIEDSLNNEILRIYNAGGNLQPLVAFIEKLAENPRKEVLTEIFGFIKACGLTLTANGNFLAYKNVTNDFTSIFDKQTSNAIGTVMEMPRHAVEYDPNKTCSAGLHFAAWGYLKHYAYGQKTVLLSISPADVVSIPTDYNNMKGRACRYKVLREVDQPEELKDIAVYNESSELEDTSNEAWMRWSKSNRKAEAFPWEEHEHLCRHDQVEVEFKNGVRQKNIASWFYWGNSTDKNSKIVRFRFLD